MKEINNDFRYIYRNREAYNRDLYKNDPVGKNDFDFYPPIVAEKKRQEDIQVATSGKRYALDGGRKGSERKPDYP